MRILVTNDDGVDSVGLHVLARSLEGLGEIVVAAPDREYSGAGAGFGPLHVMQPEIHRIAIAGVAEAWAVTGPPALCVMFSRLGAFGPKFDLVVAGINPGANVGRSVYASGTVGAALTARAGGVTGIAISQAVTEGSIEGQGWDEMLAGQCWDSAGTVARAVVESVIETPPERPVVINVNVPNCAVEEMRGWRYATVGAIPPRTVRDVTLQPKIGHEGAFTVKMQWGEPITLPIDTDGGAVEHGEIAVTYISAMVAEAVDGSPVGPALGKLLTAQTVAPTMSAKLPE